MRAIQIHQPGGPEVLQLHDIPTPEPGPGQALIRVEAAGVNFVEIYQRMAQGAAYVRPLPFTPGTEGAGIVEAVGPDVTDIAVGDRVACNALLGSYATHAVGPANRMIKLPDGVSTQDAAAVLLQGMTAHYLTHDTFKIGPGSTCLIHAAAGGVGLLFCQIAKKLGASLVIGTVSTEEKAALAREAGADEVILYTQQDFVPEVKRITDGKGLDVVYDSVGKDTFLKGFDCLHPRGFMVLFGQSSGPAPEIDPQLLQIKGSVYLTRPTNAHYSSGLDDYQRHARAVLDWVQDGSLKVRIGEAFSLSQAADAQVALASRRTTGKVILVP